MVNELVTNGTVHGGDETTFLRVAIHFAIDVKDGIAARNKFVMVNHAIMRYATTEIGRGVNVTGRVVQTASFYVVIIAVRYDKYIHY